MPKQSELEQQMTKQSELEQQMMKQSELEQQLTKQSELEQQMTKQSELEQQLCTQKWQLEAAVRSEAMLKQQLEQLSTVSGWLPSDCPVIRAY